MNVLRKAMRNPNRAIKELKYKIFRPFGNQDYKRFIVLGRSRTGSSLLLQFLNSHPHIYALDEIFSKLNGRDYKKIINSAFSKYPYYINAVGFKIFYYHPLDTDDCDIWNELANIQGLYVIHLKRRNILRTLISRKLADLWGYTSYTLTSHTAQTIKKVISFTFNELENGFQSTRAAESRADVMFGANPLLTIYYEELVRDRVVTFRKITDFLDVRYVQPKAIIRKQYPEKSSDIVTNYEELKRAFDGTEWQSFFEE